MSKSKLNGVDPQDMIDRYGADAARLFVMFAAPPEATVEWSDAGVEGAHRFLKRLWTFGQARADAIKAAAGAFDWRDADPAVKAARRDVHLALKQANYDYERIQYNTVVSAGMKMLNALEAAPADARGAAAFVREGLSILIRVLYPVVPHLGCALWDDLGYVAGIRPAARRAVAAGRPRPRSRRTRSSSCCRSTASCAASSRCRPTADRAAIEAAARASAEVAKHAAGAPVKKVVVVPGRLVNVVV